MVEKDRDFTPKGMPKRDENAPIIDMNFNGLNMVIKALASKLGAFISSTNTALGQFIRINFSQTTQQANAAYNINMYGMASQGHMHKMTISKDLTIPADWCNQMVNPVVETGTIVTVEAGGLWFVDT